MKTPINFILKTITGGVFVLMPLTVIAVIIGKAHSIIGKVTSPLTVYLPERIFGLNGSILISIGALLILCFLGGLLLQLPQFKERLEFLEENILSLIPGYSLAKSMASDTLGGDAQPMCAVMIQEGDVYQLGLLIERNGDYCTIYIPGAPQSSSGEVKIFNTEAVTELNAGAKDIMKALKRLGRGGTGLLIKAKQLKSKKESL